MKIYHKLSTCMIGLACMAGAERTAEAATITQQVFATGAAVGATSPDSLVFGAGSLWAAYSNGADSTGAAGSSLVVRYSPSGAVLKTFSIAGNVDGLRIDPSGNIWALQNQDANSTLTIINPNTNVATTSMYGSSYNDSGNYAGRGFDEAAFTDGQTYLSVTNPNAGSDPIIVQLNSGLQITGLLASTFTGKNLATGQTGSFTITDPDSLKLTPGGDLALTGEGDKALVFVHNIGAPGQSVSFLPLLGTSGQTISGKPDDTVFPTASQGLFFVADTGANTIYVLTATGLAPNSVYVSTGTTFGSLDLTTGIVTPVFNGTSPHGAEFVTFQAAGIPEPGSLPLAGGGLILVLARLLYQRLGGRTSA